MYASHAGETCTSLQYLDSDINTLFMFAEIVVESVENDAGAYRHVAEDWKLLKVIHESAWEFKDHIAKDEHAILRCTGLSRFRISCPAGLDATFNVLRPDPASHLPEPQNLRNSNDMGGWGDIDTNSETDVDEATGMYTGGKDDHPKCVLSSVTYFLCHVMCLTDHCCNWFVIGVLSSAGSSLCKLC